MKLESTLTQKAGFLYLAPLADSVMLLLVFFIFLGSPLVSKSGIQVDLPASSSEMPSASATHIITVMKGDPPKLFFNESRVDLAQLSVKLDIGKSTTNQVTILADKDTAYGDVMQAAFLALKYDYQVAFATHPSKE